MRFVCCRSVFLCLLLTFVLTASSHGQEGLKFEFTDPDDRGPAHLADGSVKIGFFLEQEFKPYFSACSQNTPMKKGNKVVSTIPVSIQNALGPDQVWQWAMKPKKYTVANGFAVVSKDQTLPDVFDLRLPMDALQDPAEMLPAGNSKIIYSSNCTAILGAALGVDVNVSFPIAKLSSVVQADYQNSTSGELGLIIGVFNSPFFQLYGEQEDKVHAGFAHFVLWDWYRKQYFSQSSVPNDKYYSLLWFDGFSMYRISKQSRQVDGSVKLSGSANYLGLVSVRGSLTDDYKLFGATDVENYKFAFRTGSTDSPSFKWQQLEPPDLVAKWIKQNVFAKLDSANFNNVIHKGTPQTHNQIIQGIPPSLCDHTLWTTNPSTVSDTGTLSVTGETPNPVPNQPLPSCALTVTFTPNDRLFAGANGTATTLKYALDTTIADKTLELTAGAVPLQTNALPAMILASAAPSNFVATAQTPGYLLQWDVKALLQDDPDDQVNPSAGITFGSTTFSGCQTNGPITLIGSPTLNSSHQVTVTIQNFLQTTNAPNPSATNNVTCSVNLTLRVKTMKGHFIDLALPSGTLVFYPGLNLAPAPRFELMTGERLRQAAR
jgi:hypothetical protein